MTISGTQAARKLGIANNLAFVRKFVVTGLIRPVRFPGSKRLKYDLKDVLQLIHKCKEQPPDKTEKIKQIIKNFKQ